MGIRLFAATIAVVVSLLAGCSATIKRDSEDHAVINIPKASTGKLVLNLSGSKEAMNASDWEGFKQEWKENFAEQTGIAKVAFEMQDGSPKPTGENGVLLSVFIKDYRFIRPGTRYMVGVMAGNAFIESTLTFSDLKSGEPFGSQSANTSSSAAEGIFSPMTNKQVEAIAIDVLNKIGAAKN